MPTLNTSQLEWLRSTNQRSKLYLSILQPTNLGHATVETYAPGARQFLINNYTGDESLIKPGMTVKVGTGIGDDSIGRLRVKSFANPDILNVAENSLKVIRNQNYLTIYDDYELWPVYPRVVANGDLEIWQDYDIEYTDQNDNQDPIPIMGSAVAKALDATHPTAQVYFDWSGSYCPDGSAITGYSAIFEGGTPSTSTSATPGYVTYTESGSYWAHLTVTAANGKSYTGHRRVRIHQPDDPPIVNFELTSLSGSWDAGGWSANLRVFPQAGGPFPDVYASNYPDRAFIIIWREDWGDGVQRSIGRIADREHVLFTGWIDGETVKRAPNRKYVEFTALGTVPYIQKLRCWPVTLEHSKEPDSWVEIYQPTPYDATRFFLRWNTTALALADFYPKPDAAARTAGATNRLFDKAKYLDFSQENVTTTVDTLLDATVFAHFASDQYGRMFCEINAQMQTGTITFTLDLSDADWREEESIVHPHRTSTSWVELSGVYWDGEAEEPTPVISQAPGGSPLEEGSDQVVQNLLTPPQSGLNALAGLYLGWKNNKFPEVGLPMAGNWTNAFDIIPQESVRISFNGTETARGYQWINQQCIVRGVEHRYDYKTGNILTDLQCEVRTSGPPGVAGNYPDIPPPPPPCDDCTPTCVPCTPCDPMYPCTPPPGESWRRKVFIATRTKGIFHTHNFTGPGGEMPTWDPVNAGLPSTLINAFIGDPFDPHRHQYCIVINPATNMTELWESQWYGTSEVYLWHKRADMDDLSGAAVSDSLDPIFTDYDNSLYPGTMHGIHMNINKQGWIAVVATCALRPPNPPYRHTLCFVSHNYGLTWKLENGDGYIGFLENDSAVAPRFEVSDCHAGDDIWVPWRRSHPQDPDLYLSLIRYSSDSGEIFEDRSEDLPEEGWFGTVNPIAEVQVDPSDARYVYTVGHGKLYQSTSRGLGWTLLIDTPSDLEAYYQLSIMYTHPNCGSGPSEVLRILRDDRKLDWSNDTGEHWLGPLDQAANSDMTAGRNGISVVSDSVNYLYGIRLHKTGEDPQDDDFVAFSAEHEWDDATQTTIRFEGKSGSDRGPSAIDSIPGDCGGVVDILQVWTED